MAGTTAEIQDHLDRIGRGDAAARGLLLTRSRRRLRLLTGRMLDRFPRLRRWEQTDDVLQNVMLRLDRLLRDCKVTSALAYLALASRHLRYELIDLARHHFGPRGAGSQHATPRDGTDPELWVKVAAERGAEQEADGLTRWADFHEAIGQLPEEHRLLFDLLWYQGLSTGEAATLLDTPVSHLKQNWQAARLALMARLGDALPA